MDNKELINIAIKARENAKPLISKFKVGAALLCENGNIYTGVNIEDPACLRLGLCAERLAFFKAIEANETKILKIAVVGGLENSDNLSALPCGICRQLMAIYAPNIEIIYLDEKNEINVATIDVLLPNKFNESFINEE